MFSSMPIQPGEIKRGRIGWAEISVGGALDCWLLDDPHTSGPCCDVIFSALRWKPMVHKAPFEMWIDERR